MIPTVGQIVLFNTTINGEPAARPAIVTRINEDGSVNLTVLHPTDTGVSTDLLTDPAAPPPAPEPEPEPEADIPYGEKRCDDDIKADDSEETKEDEEKFPL